MKFLIGEDSLKESNRESFEVEKRLGTAVFKETGEGQVPLMIGVEYTNEETANYGKQNASYLLEKGKVEVDPKTSIVSVRNPLNLEEMFTTISSKRKGGFNYGINDYMKDEQIFVNGELLTSEAFFRKLGFDKNRSTLQFFIDSSIGYGKRYLIPEVIREVIFTALMESPRYQMLTGGRASRSLSNPESEIPEVLYSGDNMLMEDVGEAENLPSVEIAFQSRKIKVFPRGVRVPINAKVIRYVQFPVLAESLRQIGMRLANQESDLCIDTLINGDRPNSGYPAGVMGVYAPASKIAYKDIIGLMLRYVQINGYLPNVCLGNEAELIRLLTTADFMKTDKNAQALFEFMVADGELRRSLSAVPSSQIPNDSLLFVDTARAIQHLVLEGLTVDEEHHKRTDSYEYFVRLATGFENIDQGAKVMMDGSVNIADYPIPSYLDLKK